MADDTQINTVRRKLEDSLIVTDPSDDDLLIEIRELIEDSFTVIDSSSSSQQQQQDDDLLIEDSFTVIDSSDEDSDDLSIEFRELMEDSFAVIDSSDEDSSDEDSDDPLIEIRELIGVVERNSSARAVTKRSIQILSELAKNEDNVNLLVRSGVVPALVKHLQETQWPNEAVIGFDELVTDSWPLEHEVENHGKVLSRLLYRMHSVEKVLQKGIVLALAHFCSPDDQETIFVDNNGLDLLLKILQSAYYKHQGNACAALCRLAEKATSVSPVDAGPSSPISQVYLGEEYVNNPMVSDVTFIVEGKRFYAHKIVLLASSDAFRAMFDGGYKERDAKDIQIPDISWKTFELMMRFIYTGSVEVNMGIAQDLLKAADQYLLDGLKRLCEYTMARDINADNLVLMYDLSKTYNAVSLRNGCILFVLDQFDKLHSKPWYASFVLQILPEIRNYFMTTLTKPMEANSQQ